MKLEELIKYLLFPFLPALHNKIRRDLRKIINERGKNQNILDIGGRKSPYTIGLKSIVTIIDKHPSNSVQKSLNLGIDNKIIRSLKDNRSNIKDILVFDITSQELPIEDKFDIVIAIEVIEHIKDIQNVLKNILSLLKPGGILYMTTPNGDYIKNEPPNYNPDHFKHYKKKELVKILEPHFCNVQVDYGIKMGKFWINSGRSWSLKYPFKLINTFYSSIINQIQSVGKENESHRTAHLFAIAKKLSK
tara:strand:- start:83 stop:823 length:741 start_codon:yes stop_codon:yes gene_type:complete